MKRFVPRLGTVAEYLRSALWPLPSASVIAALALGAVLTRIEIDVADYPFRSVLFTGGVEGARALLQVIAGSMITVTSLVFSLTVVVLQLSASNYSPNVLTQLMRDRGNQVVLSVFLATFSYSYMVLRTIRSKASDQEAFLPQLAVSVLLLFALASLAALVYFIHHISTIIKVDSILASIQNELHSSIDSHYPDAGGREVESRGALLEVPDHARQIVGRRSGYVQGFNPQDLVDVLSDRDLYVCYRYSVGEHVTAGTPLASLWRSQADADFAIDEEIADSVHSAVPIMKSRTLQEDPTHGIRQIVDVALRALSPGMNDPTTAVDAIGRLATVLEQLSSKPLLPRLGGDSRGVVRVSMPAPSFDDYLDLVCRQLRLYGAHDVVVVEAMLKLLEDAGYFAPPEAHDAIRTQITDLVLAAEKELEVESDRAAVRSKAARARRILEGESD